MDSGLNLNPDVPLGLPRAIALLESFPGPSTDNRQDWQWPGCTSQHPCRLGRPRTVSRKQLCQPAASTSQTALGRESGEISPREKLHVPGKGTRTPPTVPASKNSLALSQSPDFTGSQICHQPVHQHKPPWQREFWWLLFPSLPPEVGHSWFSH